MANYAKFHSWAPGPGTVLLSARFWPNGSNAPTGLKGKHVVSVSRTGTGTFRVTFEGRFNDILGIVATPSFGTATDAFLQVINWGTSGDNTYVDIANWDVSAAGVADIAANSRNSISVLVLAKDTSV